jgi:ketosteroid isomerase-like protein
MTTVTKQEIAMAFSGGQFETVYPHLSDHVLWTVVGEDSFAGKAAVIQQCENVAAYFKTVTTRFTAGNIIADKNRVAIDGTAAFIKDGAQVAFVWACDVYEFAADGKIEKINSYCIQKK